MNKFKERLKELREEKHLTRIQLANAVGVSATAIGRWENGLRSPTLDSLIILVNFFDCTADYLIGISDII